MTVIAWPHDALPQSCTFGLQKSTLQFVSPFNGTAQTVDLGGDRWTLSLAMPARRRRDGRDGAVEALMMRLVGGIDLAACWHFARPIPVGTMRGTPTVTTTTTRGAATLPITTTAAATLKAGDMFSAGGQLFMVATDCVANGAGALVVPLVNRVRATINAAAAVAWNKPTATFAMLGSAGQVTHVPLMLEGAAFDLVEVW